MSDRLTVCVFEGDGIGPEIMEPTLDLIRVLAERRDLPAIETVTMPAGAGHYRDHGVALPEDSLAAAREADAILLSAMGLPDIRYPDGTEISPQIELRMALHLYAGVRPVLLFGQPTPLSGRDALDFVILRESTEGLFHSHGRGTMEGDLAAEETMRITRDTSEKLFDFAFGLARQRAKSGRGQGRVHCVDKANVFQAFAFFRRVFRERAVLFPDVEAEAIYVDATALWMVQRPEIFDVLVTENMFGDILSDLGAGLMGGLGFAPSADIGDRHAVFQPCHGSAPDIAGQGVANPIAMILSGAMMLEWLGETHEHAGLVAAGGDLRGAVEKVVRQARVRTPDMGGNDGTIAVCEAVRRALDLETVG
ncbi:MAG: isocitrate/isopropylmalate family dehydrogenase [Pseudomonadota bacterium]